MTLRDLATEVLLILGIIAEGEVPSASQAQGALRVLHSLLDGWLTERLLVYTIDRQTFTVTPSTQTYTLGPGGVWNTTPLYGATVPRPVRIQDAYWLDSGTAMETPLALLDDEEYRSLGDRTSTAGQALALYYDVAFPLGQVFLWPNPTGSGTVVLYLWRPLGQEATLDTVVSLPPGYQRMLEYNWAVDLSARYPGTLRPDIAAMAIESKAHVKLLNARTPRLGNTLGMSGGGDGSYNAWPLFLTDKG